MTLSPLTSQSLPRRVAENVDRFNSVADAWSEDRKSFRLVVPSVERGVNHAWRNKDKVARAKNSLLLLEPLLDLAAENEHHLFLIGMIVEALPRFDGCPAKSEHQESWGLTSVDRSLSTTDLPAFAGVHRRNSSVRFTSISLKNRVLRRARCAGDCGWALSRER